MKDLKHYLDILHVISSKHRKEILEKYDCYDLQIYDSCARYYHDNIDKYNGYAKFLYSDLSINEAHSVFSKCRDITDFITKTLIYFEYWDSPKSFNFLCDDIDEIKNDFFRVIYVSTSEYIEDNAQYELSQENNIVDGKLDYMFINVSTKLKPNEIYDKIEHELTHAYEDFKRQSNSKITLYQSTIKSQFDKLDFNDKDSELTKKLKSILYLLDRAEQNAFLAQFDGILGNNKYKTIADAYDKIYKSKLYKQIKDMTIILDFDDKNITKSICDEYRYIYGVKDSDNKIIKKIRKEWERFQEHFRRNIYQCVCDHIETYMARDSFGTIGSDNIENDFEKTIEKYINKSIFVE